MPYKVIFFNTQSLHGFTADFDSLEAAEKAEAWFKDGIHYNNRALVLDDFTVKINKKVADKKGL